MIFGMDGNAIDMATMTIGALSIFIRPCRSGWDRQKAVTDFLNGAAIIPFAIMVGTTFWTSLIDEVMKSKISLGLAGFVGLLFVIAEVLNAGKPIAENKQT